MRATYGTFKVYGHPGAAAGLLLADWHQHCDEGDHLTVCAHGKMVVEFSHDGKTVAQAHELSAKDSAFPCVFVPKDIWHRATALADGTTMMCVFAPEAAA